MRSVLFALSICATAIVPHAALAETEEERLARCEAQAAIVELAVTKRGEGKRTKRAIRQIQKEERISDTPNEAIVELLVTWVYGLPEDQLTPEAVTAFQTQCAAYDE